jgi:hypothetical protein
VAKDRQAESASDKPALFRINEHGGGFFSPMLFSCQGHIALSGAAGTDIGLLLICEMWYFEAINLARYVNWRSGKWGLWILS